MAFIDQDQLLERFSHAYEALQREKRIKSTLAELDDAFGVIDYLFSTGYVSTDISCFILARARGCFSSWVNQFQTWLTPNPYSFIEVPESQAFSEEEKEEMKKSMRSIMVFLTDFSLARFTSDKTKEAELIDAAVFLWKDLEKQLTVLYGKVNKSWREPITPTKRENISYL